MKIVGHFYCYLFLLGEETEQFKPQQSCSFFLSSIARLMVFHPLPILFLVKLLHNHQLQKYLTQMCLDEGTQVHSTFILYFSKMTLIKGILGEVAWKCFMCCLKRKACNNNQLSISVGQYLFLNVKTSLDLSGSL